MQQIKFYGLGGQGAVTAAKMLSIATSLYEGHYAITIPAYGHERRGAPVFANVIADSVPVTMNCFVYEPDYVIVMDEKMPEKDVDVAAGIHDHTILVLNTAQRETAEKYQKEYGFSTVFYVDATHIALETINKNIPNVAILGALAKAGFVSLEALEKTIMDIFHGKAESMNIDTARKSYEHTKRL